MKLYASGTCEFPEALTVPTFMKFTASLLRSTSKRAEFISCDVFHSSKDDDAEFLAAVK